MKKDSAESGWEDFIGLCALMKTPENFDPFLALFLTIEERETMCSRYLIIKALLEGKLTQREISQKHQVSIAQITRGSNALKILDPSFRKLLEKKLEIQKTNKLC